MSTETVLPLPDVKAYLGITGQAQDVDLMATRDAACAAVAGRVGPLEPSAVTQRCRGGGAALVLSTLPVIAVTSVTARSGGVVASDWDDLAAGLLYGTWCEAYYDVVYQAGYVTLPADLRQGLKELVRHLWSTQRTKDRRTVDDLPGSAYAWPTRVEQLVAPYAIPGFA